MEALAELELRENAQHKASKANAIKDMKLFDLFRQTMLAEVDEVHRMQEEMHQKHSAAFVQLVANLSAVAVIMRKYTIDALNTTDVHIDTLNATEERDRQLVLKTILDKMNTLNRKVEDLHSQTRAVVNATEGYAQVLSLLALLAHAYKYNTDT